MKPLPRFTTVIHVSSDAQAVEQANIAFDNGAGGIFLIDHDRYASDLIETYERVRGEICYENKWVGVNFLDQHPWMAFQLASTMVGLDAVWSDGYQGLEPGVGQKNRCMTFVGSAFKYQRHPLDVAEEAKRVSELCDVVTTSGPGTGMAASIDKIRLMKGALGEKPLALASGVTVDNVGLFLPYVDCFLVATGISKSFHELDPEKVKAMAQIINNYGIESTPL